MAFELPKQGSAEVMEGVALELRDFVSDQEQQFESEAEHIIDSLPESLPEEARVEISQKVRERTRGFKSFLKTYISLIIFAGLVLWDGPSEIKNTENMSFKDLVARAKMAMSEKGITQEQEAGYIPMVNPLIYRTVFPADYGGHFQPGKIFHNLAEGRKEYFNTENREDAWRLYLGLPQIHNTFSISDYVPSKSKERKYYFRISNFPQDFLNELGPSSQGRIKMIVDTLEMSKEATFSMKDNTSGVMGMFTWSKGEDERGHYVSYYDKWDLKVPIENGSGFFGKPFEIYDRLYYDPATFELVN